MLCKIESGLSVRGVSHLDGGPRFESTVESTGVYYLQEQVNWLSTSSQKFSRVYWMRETPVAHNSTPFPPNKKKKRNSWGGGILHNNLPRYGLAVSPT